MMLRAVWSRRQLEFKEVAVTSRQSMHEKETFFIKIWDDCAPEVYGVGECALFRGLSSDDTPRYADILAHVCRHIDRVRIDDIKESSIRFGVETALRDLAGGGLRVLWDTPWTRGESEIKINGLVWMGDRDTMLRRIIDKIDRGFRCIKLKIGGIDFSQELELISYIRESFTAGELEIRLDANGAFRPSDALHRIDTLARYDIHSIEQPIRQGQWQDMGDICRRSPIPVALDEELIGTYGYDDRCRMLDAVMPQYVILKPSLCGGFANADGWIADAADRSIGWWATSALESNIGLNAIAQWVSAYSSDMPQGLGTGALYKNNIPSPLVQERDAILSARNGQWDLSSIQWSSL